MSVMDNYILQVHGLQVTFTDIERNEIHVVDGVSFSIKQGETLALVGESGCGKSVTSLALLRLLDGNGRIRGGNVLWQGRDILSLPLREVRSLRGREIAMVFQEPSSALNPVYTIGDQITESMLRHQKVSPAQAKKQAEEMLRLVGIPEPRKRLEEYPHALSGGMKQRAMIAMALSCRPRLLIADEPTTSLDVTIQAQILELIKELQKRFHMAILLITHDLGIVANMADRILIMYAGKVVEEGNKQDIFRRAAHPYTRGLLNSIPRMDQAKGTFASIPGTVPDPAHFPEGCRFHNRCGEFTETCLSEPGKIHLENEHFVLCHYPLGQKTLGCRAK